MSKFNEWYNNLDPNTKKYIESQPIYYGKDIFKASLVGMGIGFIVGLIVGFEWAYEPVKTVFKPLIG